MSPRMPTAEPDLARRRGSCINGRMGTDPLAIVALVICGAAWLLTAAFLTLELLGRLPGARKRNARAFRIRQAAGLALMAVVVL